VDQEESAGSEDRQMRSNRIEDALALPRGADFHRCALQVNPHDYRTRFRGQEASGDAELIAGMSAAGKAEEDHAQFSARKMGSIDLELVRILVEEILEGGKDAFELRRCKYGF
jgi:hypothetical protein